MDEQKKSGRGGARIGSGRKKIQGGVVHTWTVPADINDLFLEHGSPWLWDMIRKAVKQDT